MSEINPFQSPIAPLPYGTRQDGSDEPHEFVWRTGKLLVMSKDAVLPDRCTRCNAPTERRLKRALSWHSQWLYLLLLIGPIFYVIGALIARKQATIYVGFCDEHASRRFRSLTIAWVLFLGGLAMLGMFAVNTGQPVWIVGALAMVLAAAFTSVIGAKVVTAKRIDNQFVWLKDVSPEYLDELPVFPY